MGAVAGVFTAPVGRALRKKKGRKILSSPDLVYILYQRFSKFSNFKGEWLSHLRYQTYPRLAGPSKMFLQTLELMLLFKGVCCTLTIHTAKAVTHKTYVPISYPIDIHQAPRLSAHLVYILYFKFSKKSKIKGAILTNCSSNLFSRLESSKPCLRAVYLTSNYSSL